MDAIEGRNDLKTDIELLTKSIFSKKIVEHCLFKWTIEHFSLIPGHSEICITSPSFCIDSSFTSTTWFINFYPYSMSGDKKCVAFSLNRHEDDGGPNKVVVTYTIGLKNHVRDKERCNVSFHQGEVDDCEYILPENLDSQNALYESHLIVFCEMYITLLEYEDNILTQKFTNQHLDLVLLSSDISEFAQNSEASDVLIQVKDFKFSAHKAILAARSPVFASMLKGDCSSLDLLKEDYDHISNIISYIYSGAFNLIARNGNLGIGLYECAVRYSVDGLKRLLNPTEINVRTTISIEQTNFTWTIDIFKDFDVKIGECMTSPDFNGGFQNSPVWCIDFFPQGKSETPNSVGIFVRTTDPPKVLDITVNVSILDENKKELYRKRLNKPLHDCIFGFPEFVDKNILTQEGEFIRSGKLNINCSIFSLVPKNSYERTCLFQCSSLANHTCSELERLSKDFEKLLDNQTFSDIVLKAGYKIYSVHKMILSARAPALWDLLMTKKVKDCPIVITGVSEKIFEAMIFYIYTGKLREFSSDFAIDLYKAAGKYNMKSLINSCSHFLSSILDTKCVCDVIILSHTHQDKRLMSKCLNYIENNDEVLRSNEWANLTRTKQKLSEKLLKWLSRKSRSGPNIP